MKKHVYFGFALSDMCYLLLAIYTYSFSQITEKWRSTDVLGVSNLNLNVFILPFPWTLYTWNQFSLWTTLNLVKCLIYTCWVAFLVNEYVDFVVVTVNMLQIMSCHCEYVKNVTSNDYITIIVPWSQDWEVHPIMDGYFLFYTHTDAV